MAHFNREARERHMRFAVSDEALWTGNFRDLGASVTRMATLVESGRTTETLVDDEILRPQRQWQRSPDRAAHIPVELAQVLGSEVAAQLDLFDAVQLAAVPAVCRQSNSLSDAGRKLYGVSRSAKGKPNGGNRLKNTWRASA